MTGTTFPPVSAAATNKLSSAFGASYADVLVGTIEGSAGNYGNGSVTVANMPNTFAANPNNQLVMGWRRKLRGRECGMSAVSQRACRGRRG